jgi:hypothetical protein
VCALCERSPAASILAEKWGRVGGGSFRRGPKADLGLTPPGYIMSPLRGLLPGWFAISMRARGLRRRARLCRRSAAYHRAGLVCDQHACPGFTPPGYIMSPPRG